MNCDLLLHSTFLSSIQHISTLQEEGTLIPHVMIMGRRYNFMTNLKQDYTSLKTDEFDSTIEQLTKYNDLFISVAQDFFIFNYGTLDYSLIPDLVIGRNGYDNYMVDFCFSNNIPLIDISQSGRLSILFSSLAIVIHQTDSDGNWAGGTRNSRDSSWNLDLVGTHYEYESVSRATYQLSHYSNGMFNLRQYPGYDNAFSPEEIHFISRFIPPKAKCFSLIIISS